MPSCVEDRSSNMDIVFSHKVLKMSEIIHPSQVRFDAWFDRCDGSENLVGIIFVLMGIL